MSIRLPKVGDEVNIIEKRNYGNGKLTTGVVKRLLSRPQEVHPRGNKVMLEEGIVGRVVSYVDEVGVETFVDPSLRERYARGIRSQRINDNHRRGFGKQEIFQEKRRDSEKINEPAERSILPSDLPGEDDLR